jgi:hypothetical protein
MKGFPPLGPASPRSRRPARRISAQPAGWINLPADGFKALRTGRFGRRIAGACQLQLLRLHVEADLPLGPGGRRTEQGLQFPVDVA